MFQGNCIWGELCVSEQGAYIRGLNFEGGYIRDFTSKSATKKMSKIIKEPGTNQDFQLRFKSNFSIHNQTFMSVVWTKNSISLSMTFSIRNFR